MKGIRLLAAALAALVICGTGIALAAQESESTPTDSALSAAPRDAGVEIPSKRTATSSTFRLPNGSLETRIYESPVNYRDAEGDWQPIEEGLEPSGEAALTNGENSFDVSLPARMGEGEVRLDTGQEWIAYELLGPPTEAVRAEGDTATYEAADSDVSFDLSSLANGIKEDIEIAGPSDPSTFGFALSAAEGITPTSTADGAIEFQDEAAQVIAELPPPTMSDSAPGGSQASRAVDYHLEPASEGRWLLTVEADRDWLTDPDRVWPVSIDPTLTTSPSLECLYGGRKGENGWRACGASTQVLTAGYWPQVSSSLDEWKRSALRFDLSAIPKTSYLTKATLGLYAPGVAQSTSGVEVRRATKSWNSNISWLRYTGILPWAKEGGDYLIDEGAAITTAERGAQAGWWSFSGPLTKLVQSWVSGGTPNQGVLVKLIDDESRQCGETSCTQRYVEFNSSASADPSLRPYMAVTYYPPAPSGSKVTSPSEGTQTARRFKLKASGSVETTGVTFQYRQGTNSAFETIPPNLVRDAQGAQISWPLPLKGGTNEPVYFDAAHSAPGLEIAGGPIQVRALFDGPVGFAGYSVPVSATVDPNVGGTRDPVAPVGPGAVNLLTGNFTLSRTDVSIPVFGSALEFSRSHNSRDAGGEADTSVLGRGWKSSVPVEAAGGAAWQKVREVVPTQGEKEEGLGEYALLVDLEGYEYAFEKVGETYVSPPEAPDLLMSRQDATHLALTDPDGNRTIFEKESSGSDYLPASISQTGGAANSTRMVYQLVGGKKRLSMVIAPTASGVSCPEATATTTLGCRVLTFSYKAATTWGAPSSLGDRLSVIKYYGPSSASSMSVWEVAKYVYDAQGRLVQQWDPRISSEGVIKESYSYEGGQIRTITPAGEEPWTLEYETASNPEFPNARRLLNVKRASLLSSPSVAQTTIAYGVPISGSGSPYDMSVGAIAQWGQQDIPTDATAIFPPDQIPGSPPSSYSRATVYYVDGEGQLVNTATPSGAGTSAPSITTVEPDEHGNIIRELSAQNRLRALAAGAGSVARSHELETKRLYWPEGTMLQEEWGPLHEVRLESGSVVQARMHRALQYDEGAPAPPPGTPWPYLPTRETNGAWVSEGSEFDQRVTQTKYNWTLRKPTDTIVDPLGLNLRTHIEYDPTSGLPTERRLPANPNGGDAHTTKILYYTAGAHPSDSYCGNRPAWANLPCKVLPAAQPGTSGQPQILVTKYPAYSPLGQPTEVLESPGGQLGSDFTRRTVISYDQAGREMSRSQEGGGASIPEMRTLYSSTTGRPTTQRFQSSCPPEQCGSFDDQALTTTYDALGRPVAYEDADGNVSSASYDLLGRPVTTSDGKGIQTRTYDPTSGLLVKLEDSGAGTFTASYNADGSLVEQGLPNGLVAKTTYDEVGSPIHLSYEKKTLCSIECLWLDFDAERSITGQVLAQTSNLSAQQYSYDKAGRLTLVKDTPQGGGCTTRSYSFDKDSNRTALVTRAPGIGGACDTSSAGTTQNYSYDAADRLLGTGMTYDNYGRITSLPASYAGGSTLTSTYYTNDLIKSQSQGGVTNTYELDSALRQRLRTQTGGSEPGTEVYHYAGGSDSPAWIDRGSTWSRSVVGIDGGLTAIQDSAKGTTLQLANLHGDIVATASTNPEATKLLATFEFDEFGNPKQSGVAKYGWLGNKMRRTELPSGIIQMGVRSYIPALGRFLSVDPVTGGSANTYDYANQDPVNNFDLTGECWARNNGKPYKKACMDAMERAVRRANQKGRLSIRTTERGLRALLRRPLFLERMIRKVHQWGVEDLRRLKRVAAAAPQSPRDDESLCDSAERASKVIDSAGFTSAVIPGGQGLALAIGIPGMGLTIGTWIAC